ncbi:uncharacterized protein LOC129411816 [Boleophthalmus pectinirostris]|uniref:uncharacterized protein LOC129411816 n=1 Tax=Boleophthalmus pectinirostris TaxID=150288 RepID=UPI0024317285|nr:uncharacterized protein LOC129411816 [Boleophthalmus pectinirostris]
MDQIPPPPKKYKPVPLVRSGPFTVTTQPHLKENKGDLICSFSSNVSNCGSPSTNWTRTSRGTKRPGPNWMTPDPDCGPTPAKRFRVCEKRAKKRKRPSALDRGLPETKKSDVKNGSQAQKVTKEAKSSPEGSRPNMIKQLKQEVQDQETDQEQDQEKVQERVQERVLVKIQADVQIFINGQDQGKILNIPVPLVRSGPFTVTTQPQLKENKGDVICSFSSNVSNCGSPSTNWKRTSRGTKRPGPNWMTPDPDCGPTPAKRFRVCEKRAKKRKRPSALDRGLPETKKSDVKKWLPGSKSNQRSEEFT